ncbi:MAG: LicD family protein [Bacteroidaceae bacterium]|nr:LicD family protein [Bacteroidaceae bacterium]
MSDIKTYMKDHLRAVQLKELAIMKEIHKICVNNNIDYWLDGGSMIGAMRHGGFIPWDDDIDIAMRRSDIPRFVEAARRELPDWLYLQSPDEDPSRLPMLKVRDLNSFLVEAGDDFGQPYPKGLFVDIFPLEPYPNISRKLCKTITKGYCRADGILKAKHYYSLRSAVELFWFGAKRAWFKALWLFVYHTRSKNVYFSNQIECNGYGVLHRYDDIFPVKPIQFEGETFLGPAKPDQYTRNIYNDYMTMPPEDKRKIHALFYAESLDIPVAELS